MATTTLAPTDTPTAQSTAARTPARDRLAPLLAAVVGIPLMAVLLLSAFAWPAASIGPRDLPIGVVGAPSAAAAVRAQLAKEEGAFTVTPYADVPAAEQAIADRDIYGAIALGPGGPVLLSSTAASPVVASLLGDLARGIGAAQGVSPQVRDVVAADPDDPRGSGLAVTVLPMVILGGALGTVTALLTRGRLLRTGVLAAGAVMAGLAGIPLIQGGLGIIGGDWWINAGVLALTVAAIAATVAGLGSLLGRPGIALGILAMVLLGNPLSGSSSAPELLPQPWGAVGQALPPGAGASLLRDTAFFDGAAGAGPLWVLSIWLIAGLVLLRLAPTRGGQRPVAAVPG